MSISRAPSLPHLLFLSFWLMPTGALCASAGWTRCFARTAVDLCPSASPKNLAIPRDFYSPLSTQYLRVTILLTLYSMVWEWQALGAGLMYFFWPKLLAPHSSFTVFPSLLFLLVSCYCGAGVLGLIVSIAHSRPSISDLF